MFVPDASGKIVPNGGDGAPISVVNHNHFDVGLESVDMRIAQAAGPISAETLSAIRQAMRRPSIA